MLLLTEYNTHTWVETGNAIKPQHERMKERGREREREIRK